MHRSAEDKALCRKAAFHLICVFFGNPNVEPGEITAVNNSFGPLTQASKNERSPFLLPLTNVGVSPLGLTISEMALVTRL